MIIGSIGNMGAGKTLSLVVMGYKLNNRLKNPHIVSNFHTKITDQQINDPKQLDEVSQEKSGIQILDEIWAWADSRKSQNNDLFNEMIINSRKRGWIILYSTQDLHMVDKRLRNNTDYVIMPEHYSRTGKNDVLKVRIVDKYGDVVNQLKVNADKFYGIYDTSEEVGSKNKGVMYDDIISKYFKPVKEDVYEHKKDLISEMVIEEDLSKSDADMIATKVFNEVKKEEADA